MTDTKPQPMTDGELDNWRRALAASPEDLWSVTKCAIELFVATIDAERAARLAAEAERDRLREALRPLAVLKVPYKPQGNAGAYSIRFSDIERAQAALAGQEGGNG